MRILPKALLLGLAVLTCAINAPALQAKPEAASQPAQKAWIKRSDEYAQVLLKLQAKYAPEFAARQGVEGLDEEVSQFPSNRRELAKADAKAAISKLQGFLATEKDPLVKQDLQIMIKAAQQNQRGQELDEKYDMPYFDIGQLLFAGLRALLDDQVPENRRKAALVRLRKYAGVEPGFEPLVDQAKARTLEWRKPGQVGPPKAQLATNLARADFFINGT